jgi:ribosome-binding protein aMBF1 (putative translation factor)
MSAGTTSIRKCHLISPDAPKPLSEIRAQRTETPQIREQIADQRGLLAAEAALHAVREHAGVSQAELAARLQSAQLSVSDIDRGSDDLRLSTLTRYVEALGGTLQLVATLGDEEVSIDLGRLDT